MRLQKPDMGEIAFGSVVLLLATVYIGTSVLIVMGITKLALYMFFS